MIKTVEVEPINAEPPVLRGRTTATQGWRDLAFLHWRVDASVVVPLLPAGTRPDEFDGSSWVGLIGFDLADATLWGSPPIPFAGSFTEINVRLYAVDESGRRGVVFRSLEASRLAAVIGARAAFSIPYFWSRTGHRTTDDMHEYASKRHGGGPRTRFAIRRSRDRVDIELADFLTARWALFATRRGDTVHLPNTHERWELFDATLLSLRDELLAAAGLPGIATRLPDSVLYARGVDARFGRPD